MAFAFEKLVVYQKSVDFADQICLRSENFARGYGFLADQLNRASSSISANIAEGNGRFTKPDRKNFFGIARGSVHECVPLLELGRRMQARGLVHVPDHALELTPEEINIALTDKSHGAEELAGRHRWRTTVNIEDAPRKLGNPEPVPPLDILPKGLAYVAGFIQK
ncbi:MAG: four helix bundle protein, partial [Planctomycetaceae bacterium]